MAQAFRRVPWVEVAMSSRPGDTKGASPPKARPTNDCWTAEFKFKPAREKVLRFLWKILALAPFLSAIHERDQCHSDINWYVRMDL